MADKCNNLRTSKSNVFNVAYQQRIRILFLFKFKVNDCAEWNKHVGRISK